MAEGVRRSADETLQHSLACVEASTNGGRSFETIFMTCEAGTIYYVVLERKDESFWFWEAD